MSGLGERELILKGRKFDFERITFPGPGGKPVVREVVRHPGAVCILPLLTPKQAQIAGLPVERCGAGAVVFIRNRRYALGITLLELPAGTLEPGEQPAACAARELEEETGYAAGAVEPLVNFHTTPGMTDEVMHSFVARDLRPVGQRLEEDENIRVEVVPVQEVGGLLDRAEVTDGKTLVTLLTAARRGVLTLD